MCFQTSFPKLVPAAPRPSRWGRSKLGFTENIVLISVTNKLRTGDAEESTQEVYFNKRAFNQDTKKERGGLERMKNRHWAAHLSQSSLSPLPSFTTESQLTPAQLCTRQKEKRHLYLKLRSLIHSTAWKYYMGWSLTEGSPALQWWTWQLHRGGGAWANTVRLSRMLLLDFYWWDQVCTTLVYHYEQQL